MATFSEQLSKLEELEVSAQDTITTLQSNDGDDFVREIVNQVYQKVVDKDAPEKLNDEEGSVLDSKLLFLEELLQEPEEVQVQVKGWLSDAKRRFLFDYSPQAQLYGELLLAKANGTLETFIQHRNPKTPSFGEFIYERELSVSFNPADKPEGDSSRKLIELKLEAVIQNLTESYQQGPDLQRFLKRDFLCLGSVWEKYMLLKQAIETTPGGLKEICKNEILAFHKLLTNGYTEEDVDKLGETPIGQLKESLSEVNRSEAEEKFDVEKMGTVCYTERDVSFAAARWEQDILECVSELRRETVMEEDRIINEETKKIKDVVSSNYADSLDGICSSSRNLLRLTPEQRAELRVLQQEARRNDYLMLGEGELCDKFGKPKQLTYSLKLERKDPLDVKYGNDSGCCIGVYENTGELGNAYGLPQMLVDNSIYFFGIYQKINGGKERRVGLVLAFQTLDANRNKVLAGNSIELSPKMNPIGVVPQVVEFAEEALRDFGIKNGYPAIIMSAHDYNTSLNFSQRKAEKCSGLGKLTKLPTSPQESFYSEIVSSKNHKTIDTNKGEGFYWIYDARGQ